MLDLKNVLNIRFKDYMSMKLISSDYKFEGVCVTGVVDSLDKLNSYSPKQRLADAAPEGAEAIVEYDVKFASEIGESVRSTFGMGVTGSSVECKIFFEANGIALIPKKPLSGESLDTCIR